MDHATDLGTKACSRDKIRKYMTGLSSGAGFLDEGHVESEATAKRAKFQPTMSIAFTARIVAALSTQGIVVEAVGINGAIVVQGGGRGLIALALRR